MNKASLSSIITFIFILSTLVQTSDAKLITGYTFRQWGQETLTQINSNFLRRDGLYKQSLTESFPAYAWGQGIMLSTLVAAAKIDLSYLDSAKEHAEVFHNQFWCSSNGLWGYNASANNCGDRYYDDNAWIALALMELYEISGESVYLDRAKNVVLFCMSGENGIENTPNGGIRWHESNTGGASVCSTAPTCLANLLIYQATGIDSYNTDGQRLYHWLMNSDLRYSSGIFHETNQGPLGYQTAVVTQAAVHLFQITGDNSYLHEAQRMASAMEHEFINKDTHALGQTGKWGGHDMTNAYVELYEIDHNRHWLNVATGYLEFLHDNCKDAATGRYPASWNNTSGSPSAELLDNTSAARAYWKIAGTVGGAAPIYLHIKHRASNRCLRLYDSQTADNTPLVLYDELPTYTSEMFTFVDLGNGYFNIRSWKADKFLQPYNNNSANDTNIVIYKVAANSPSQQWSLIDAGSGYFIIQNRLTGKSLRPRNSGTANNTNIVLSTPDITQYSQQWTLVGNAMPTSISLYMSKDGCDWLQPDQVMFDAGDTFSLKVHAEGNGIWRWEGPGGFTANGNQITLENIQPKSSGLYIAVYTNEWGIESSSAFNARVVCPITLYQHCNYTGWKARLGAGSYTASDLIAAGGVNNDASSAKIQSGYKVTFYDNDNFVGPVLVKTGNDSCFVDDGWNDRVSSLIIEPIMEPVAHWPLNEASGSIIYDVSKNNHNGILMNMNDTNRVAGKQCSALFLDGIDDYVQITGYKGITGTGSRTCTAWIKTTQFSGEILSWGKQSAGGKWIIRINETGSLRAEVQGGYIYGTTPINDGHWHHIAVTLKNDGDLNISKARLYIDGKEEVIAGLLEKTINTFATEDVRIGVFSDRVRYFQGSIDDVRIYTRQLDASEILSLYRSQALIGDVEPDGDVDLNDFAALSAFWQDSEGCNGDLNCDCIIDINDFFIVAEQWLNRLQ